MPDIGKLISPEMSTLLPLGALGLSHGRSTCEERSASFNCCLRNSIPGQLMRRPKLNKTQYLKI